MRHLLTNPVVSTNKKRPFMTGWFQILRQAISPRLSIRRLCQGTVGALLALLVSLSTLSGTSPAQARATTPGPQVLVVVDATLPSCTYTRTPGNHTPSVGSDTAQAPISTTHMPCPAGTIMELEAIPFSKAAARHQAYVLPLSQGASVAQKKQWEDQIQQLLQATRRTLQANQMVTPSTTCGYTVTIYSGYNIIFNDYIQGRITYYLSSSCSQVYLDTVYTDVGYVPYNNTVWWLEFDYAAYRNDCDRAGAFHELYPNTTYSFHPNQWHTAGYYGIYTFQFASIPACLQQGGGPAKTLAVGPLN